jgi:CBS domain-containing protein
MPVDDALRMLEKYKLPLLVCCRESGLPVLVGIVTAFDLL